MPTTRKTSAPKSAAKKAAPKTAKPAAKAAPKEEPKLYGMTTAQRRKAAQTVARMRKDGVAWDTPETGICAVVGIRTALIGRAILREFDNGDLIAPLTGTRAK